MSRTAVVVVVLVLGAVLALDAAACVRVAGGDYLCDHGRCPRPLVCDDSADRCVGVDVGGFDAGPFVDGGPEDGGPDDAGPEDAGATPTDLAFTTLPVGNADVQVLAVAAALEDDGTPHIAIWSRTGPPIKNRLRYATCLLPAAADAGVQPCDTFALVVIEDDVLGNAVHPSIAVDDDGAVRIAYGKAGAVALASCAAGAACTSRTSWTFSHVDATASLAPRLARSGSALAAFTCSATALTAHRCESDCGVDASWSHTSLGALCTDVDDVSFSAAGAASVVFSHFDGQQHLSRAFCTGDCDLEPSWTIGDVGEPSTGTPAARYRFRGAGDGAFLDVAHGAFAACAGCAPALPDDAFDAAALGVARGNRGDLEVFRGGVVVAGGGEGGAFGVVACASGPCDEPSAFGAAVPLVDDADFADVVVAGDHLGVVSFHAADVEWSAGGARADP